MFQWSGRVISILKWYLSIPFFFFKVPRFLLWKGRSWTMRNLFLWPCNLLLPHQRVHQSSTCHDIGTHFFSLAEGPTSIPIKAVAPPLKYAFCLPWLTFLSFYLQINKWCHQPCTHSGATVTVGWVGQILCAKCIFGCNWIIQHDTNMDNDG